MHLLVQVRIRRVDRATAAFSYLFLIEVICRICYEGTHSVYPFQSEFAAFLQTPCQHAAAAELKPPPAVGSATAAEFCATQRRHLPHLI